MLDDLIPITAIFSSVLVPVCVTGISIFQSIKSRHEERMEMIRHGIILKEPEKPKNRYSALRKGIVMAFLSLGLLIGIALAPYLPSGSKNGIYELIIISFTVMFGGFGFILYTIIAGKMGVKNDESENDL